MDNDHESIIKDKDLRLVVDGYSSEIVQKSVTNDIIELICIYYGISAVILCMKPSDNPSENITVKDVYSLFLM